MALHDMPWDGISWTYSLHVHNNTLLKVSNAWPGCLHTPGPPITYNILGSQWAHVYEPPASFPGWGLPRWEHRRRLARTLARVEQRGPEPHGHSARSPQAARPRPLPPPPAERMRDGRASKAARGRTPDGRAASEACGV